MPSFLSICLALLKFAIATTSVIQGLLIELHIALEWLRDGQDSSTPSAEGKSSDLSSLEPSNSDASKAELVASSTESAKSSDFTESFSTTNSGTESVLSEPKNTTISDPLKEDSMPSAFRSSLESQDNSQNASVGFIDGPPLTNIGRIDSMEKIELVIKTTCEFIPPEAPIFPQMQSQFSSPSITDSDTPENIKYIEKASRLLTVYSKLDQGQEYCDINSSTTEVPASGSPTSATDNEDAAESTNLPQLHVESPSSTENDKSPSKRSYTQSSVRFLLPDSHTERESKGFRRESKFRKKTNETSTSEEEKEANVSRKRRASPGKFHKSPKKMAETTASIIRGYKLSPLMKSDEKKREDTLSYGNTLTTRSLNFDFGIRRKSENDTDLLTSKDENSRNLKSVELSSRTIEDDVGEKASFQRATSKSESANETISKTDSIPETTPSATIFDNIAEVSASEGTEGFSPEIGSREQMVVADCTVDGDENGCNSTSEGTEVSSSFANETSAFQDTAVDSKADFTFSGDKSNNSLAKDSTYFDNSCEMSLTGHLELVDTDISQGSKLPVNDELASDKNNEKVTNEQENKKSECTLNIHLLEIEKKLNCNVQLETTDQVSNEESCKESETEPNEKLVSEMSGNYSCHEGSKGLASQLENRTEFEEFLNSDRNEDKSKSSNFSSDNLTDKNFVKNQALEADIDNFSVLKEVSHQINTVVKVCNVVEIDEAFSIGQGKTDEVESVEVSNSSLHTEKIVSQSEAQSPERTQQTIEIKSENASLLLSQSKSSSNEADEENTISEVDRETSDYRSSNLNSDLKKYNCSKSFFTHVLEELLQRFESISQSNSPAKTQALLSTLELKEKAVSSDLQHSTIKTDVNKVSNRKKYFDIVLKDLVQQVKSTAVSNSFTSIKDEESRALKIEVLSNTSIATSPKKDSTESSILEETEIEVNVVVNSDNLIADAENFKQDNLEFELYIVPQPVPCETAIQIRVENLISNETSSDLSEIKIVDSQTSEDEVNAPNIIPAESNLCHLTASVPNESTTAEILPYNGGFYSMYSNIKALVELANDDFISNLFEESKDNFIEIAVNEVRNNDISENTHIEVTNKCRKEALIEMAKEVFADNSTAEETHEGLAENSLVETANEETTGSKLVEAPKDNPMKNDETANRSDESVLVKLAKCDSTENTMLEVVKDDLNENISDVMHDCSVESNAGETFTNLDSSVAEEASANDKEESLNENKPWKKKQRKSKKKRRN